MTRSELFVTTMKSFKADHGRGSDAARVVDSYTSLKTRIERIYSGGKSSTHSVMNPSTKDHQSNNNT
jgi:hypothetical protein